MTDHLPSQPQTLSERFRKAISAGKSPSIEKFLSGVDATEQSKQFRELLSVELHERRKAGDALYQEKYQDQHPQHAGIVAELFEGFDSFRVSCDSTTGFEPNSSSHVERVGGKLSKLVSRYRLLEKLGKGGFGEVWLAFDDELRTHVAIKGPRTDRPVSEDAVRAFLDEARKTRQLECPGVVPVYDVVEEDGVCFVVMKYMKGGNLADKIKQAKKSNSYALPPQDAAELVAQVADTIHRIHVKNFVHRDIKPHNILLDENGHHYVADFGLAVDEDELYQEGEARVGTYAYMSPEQAEGKSNLASPQSDVYSLGVVLYELLTCRLPYEDVARTPREYLEKVQSGVPPRRTPQTISADVPTELDQVCMKCLAQPTGERYGSAKAFADALRSAFVGAAASQSRRQLWPSPSTRTVVFAVAMLLVVVTVSLLLKSHWPSLEDKPTAPDSKQPEQAQIVEEKAAREHAIQLRSLLGEGQYSNPSEWNVEDSLRRLTVTALYRSLVSFGSVREEPLEFELTVQQLQWPGEIGVFFGHLPNDDPAKMQYHEIAIVRKLDGSFLLRSSIYTYHRANPKGVHTQHRLAEWPIEEFDFAKNTINVRINNQNLSRVGVNGIYLDDKTLKAWNRSLKVWQKNLQGNYGALNTNSHGVFFAPRINGENVLIRK